MGTRREFLGTMAATSVVLPASVSLASTGKTPDRLHIHKAIYDSSFVECAVFGRAAAHCGIRVHEIGDDISDLWYGDLHHRWRNTADTIAGLTSHRSLVYLEQLARTYGRRVVVRGTHRRAGSMIEHELTGPAYLIDDAISQNRDAPWSWQLGVAVSHWSPGAHRTATVVTTTSSSALSDGRWEQLASWVIAPRAGV